MSEFDSEFASLTDIGRRCGVSCRVVGKWLADLGLRHIGGSPSREAFEAGLVKKAPTNRGDGDGYFYVWQIARTVGLLEKAGHKQAGRHDDPLKAAETRTLIRPFSHRPNGGDGYEIINGDGVVFGWIRGEAAANAVVRLLNLADEHGKLPAA